MTGPDGTGRVTAHAFSVGVSVDEDGVATVTHPSHPGPIVVNPGERVTLIVRSSAELKRGDPPAESLLPPGP